ncbi:MAG: glucokinase [Hyphomicrobiales bacterium]|nr:glucokinase [Hyphomicrobiales bacterium]
MQFPFPALLCDIGGTNVRFAMAHAPGARAQVVGLARTDDFTGLVDAARHVMREQPLAPRSLVACAAGPALGRTLQLTNADWRIDGVSVARDLGLEQGLLLNDFEAMAFSLPSLGAEDVRAIGPHAPGAGCRIVLGPGTGLGVAALAEIDGRFVAMPSEAGHVDFGPVGAEQERLWPHIERFHGRVTSETVLSGPGLERLYAARLTAAGAPVRRLTAAEITLAGLREEGEARETLRLFWRLAARFAGDMALVYMARGGVTLAGGVLPRIESLLDERAFRESFEAKSPMDALARSIPTRLVTAQQAVLHGMAAIAAQPERFAIDYGARNWR